MPLRWTEHRGTKILEIDYRNLDEAGMMALIEEAAVVAERAPEMVRTLSRFEGVAIGPKFMDHAKRVGKEKLGPHRKKGAVVGNASGFAGVLFSAYNFLTGGNMRAFADVDKAMNWLAEG